MNLQDKAIIMTLFWEEEDDKTLPYTAPDSIFDVMFSITCKSLPVDHAWELSQQLLTHLPWLDDYEGAGIHQIHVAESNNGWIRPEEADALLFPSKRTKMSLRIPAERYHEVQKLIGTNINIEGHPLEIGKIKKKPLGNSGVIFARYVLLKDNQTENDFLTEMAAEIKKKTNTSVKKMLCGKNHLIKTPETTFKAIHLMIADLDDETSIKIQQQGLGLGRELGCGLFLPHKSIKTLKPTE